MAETSGSNQTEAPEPSSSCDFRSPSTTTARDIKRHRSRRPCLRARHSWLPGALDARYDGGVTDPIRKGSALAVLAALMFGVTAPLIQRFGHDSGPVPTAALLYLGAALATL